MSSCPQKVRRHQAIFFSLGIISDSRNRKEVTTVVIFYKINIYRINIVRIITISECGALTPTPRPPNKPQLQIRINQII